MYKILVAAMVATFAPLAAAMAQTGPDTLIFPIVIVESPSEQAARAGLLQTPFGAFPPIGTSTITGELQRSPVYSLRYGFIGGTGNFSFNNVGLAATLPAFFGITTSLTGGMLVCNSCGTTWMGGLSADYLIHEWPFLYLGEHSRLRATINGNLGLARTSDTYLSDGDVFSAAATLPISFPSTTPRLPHSWTFVPWMSPGIGYGQAKHIQRLARVGPAGQLEFIDESSNGTRFVIGGGLAVYRRGSNFAVNFGAQYIATQFRNYMAGIGVNYGGN